MNLQVFNQSNVKHVQSGKPTVRFARSGGIYFSKVTVEALKLDSKRLSIAQDQDKKQDWYIIVNDDEHGFLARDYKGGSYAINSAAVAKMILKQFADPVKPSIGFYVATEPVQPGVYAIITKNPIA